MSADQSSKWQQLAAGLSAPREASNRRNNLFHLSATTLAVLLLTVPAHAVDRHPIVGQKSPSAIGVIEHTDDALPPCT